VTPEQIDPFYQVKIARTYQQRGYDLARSTMQRYLLEKEKRFDIHSHLYEPMISSCGSPSNFETKIRSDCNLIHSPPKPKLSSPVGMYVKWYKAEEQFSMLKSNILG
jgi:hypothetical protein